MQEAIGSCCAPQNEPGCGLELKMAEHLLAINLNLCPLRDRLKVFTGCEQTRQWRRGGGTREDRREMFALAMTRVEAAGDAAQAD